MTYRDVVQGCVLLCVVSPLNRSFLIFLCSKRIVQPFEVVFLSETDRAFCQDDMNLTSKNDAIPDR